MNGLALLQYAPIRLRDQRGLGRIEAIADLGMNAAEHLRRPFAAEAVRWKVQAGTLVVPYVDARLVIERLNLVCPHLWHDEYEPVGGGKGLLCRLTIDGIIRVDVGEGYQGKGLYPESFKRAAVKFRVQVHTTAMPE